MLVKRHGFHKLKIGVYVRGFSAEKSDVENLQRPLVKPEIGRLFLNGAI